MRVGLHLCVTTRVITIKNDSSRGNDLDRLFRCPLTRVTDKSARIRAQAHLTLKAFVNVCDKKQQQEEEDKPVFSRPHPETYLRNSSNSKCSPSGSCERTMISV